MKFILFYIALIIGIPVIAGATAFSKKLKYLALIAMVTSFLFNSQFSINLMSMEQYRGPVRGFEITIADIIAVGLIIGMLLRTGSKIVWKPRFMMTLLAFFLFTVFNVYRSDYQVYGWFAVWQLFRMGLMYWCITNFFATEDYSRTSIRVLMTAYTVTASILTVIALKQKYLDGIYRIFAFFDHSNTVPSFALFFLCAMMVWVLTDTELRRMHFLIPLGATLGMTVAIISTGSRTGILTAAGSLVAALVISNFRLKNTRIKFTTIFLMVCMILGGLMVIDTVIDRFLNAPEESEEARNEFEIAAVMMADDHNFGVGLNQYSQVLTVTEEYRKHITVMKYEEQAGVAHHIYLLTAAEMGYWGMYFFIFIIISFIFSMFLNGISWKSMEQRLLLALVVGFAAVFAIGLYEWVLRQSPVLYQLVVASAFGQSLITKVKNDKKLEKG
ncbi:MAG: O-antigen ligase family protein [Sphaerochaetaceae bacterium]|nr:O-antigen ligase family protein [Sphaerochaetaceae bacterium]